MLMDYREITAKEKRDIKELVTKSCANYCCHNKECLLLDSACYMLNMHYFRDKLCKYFQSSVLPINPSLEASFCGNSANVKYCVICGTTFPTAGRKQTCSEKCRLALRRNTVKNNVMDFRQKNRGQV